MPVDLKGAGSLGEFDEKKPNYKQTFFINIWDWKYFRKRSLTNPLKVWGLQDDAMQHTHTKMFFGHLGFILLAVASQIHFHTHSPCQ